MQYSEKDIEQMILDDIDIIDPSLYVIGNQISLGGYGILDILAFNPFKKEYVVIELKSETVTDKALTQIMRYMQGVKDFIIGSNHDYPVKGILAAPEIEDETKSALRYVQNTITFCELSLSIQSEGANFVRVSDGIKYKDDKKHFHKCIDEFNPESYIIDNSEEGEKCVEA